MENGFVERAIGRRSNITLFVGTQMLFTRRLPHLKQELLALLVHLSLFLGYVLLDL
jgi:hypothetical protein